MKTGIYCWINRVNGKRYVGSAATGFSSRLRDYRRDFARGRCHNPYLLNVWKKYGGKNFVFHLLERCPPEQCLEREAYWIEFYKTTDERFGYNICTVGKNQLGAKRTPEQRARMSAAGKRRKPSPEFGKRMAEIRRGVPLSPETKAKMSLAAKKRYEDKLEREKTANAVRQSGVAEVFKRPDVQAKRLAALRSPETRAKMSASYYTYRRKKAENAG